MITKEQHKEYVEFVKALSEEPNQRFILDPSLEFLADKDPLNPALLHASMGLVTEAAEVMDLIKKHRGYKRPLDMQKLKDELGDMLFYWTLAVDACGSSIEEIMEMNVAKLTARYPDGYSNKRANKRNLKVEQKAQKKGEEK